MSLEIITDNKWKPFRYGNEVPKKVLDDDFDWMDEDQIGDGFFKYKGQWYHLDEFMRISKNAPAPMKKWHGYLSDSFFSGVLIKVSSDGEEYIVGTYLS